MTDYFSELIFHSTLVFSSVQKETGNGLLIWQCFNEIINNMPKVSSVVQNEWLHHYFHYQYFERDYICVIVPPRFSFFKKPFFFELCVAARTKEKTCIIDIHSWIFMANCCMEITMYFLLKIYTWGTGKTCQSIPVSCQLHGKYGTLD